MAQPRASTFVVHAALIAQLGSAGNFNSMALRLIQMSDIHFGYEDAAAVAAAADYVRAEPFDLLMLTGDITQLGAEKEFAAAAVWLETLPGPILSTPGNHDTPWAGLVERALMPWDRYNRLIGPVTQASFIAPGLTVRSMNSARGWQIRLNWSKGEVSAGQARRAGEALEAAAPGARRVLACHHPLIEVPGEPMTSRVRGGQHAARRLVRAGADLVVTGHLHVPFVQALPYGDGLTYAVGAGTLSRRERGEPPSFNVITLEDDRMTVAVMAWDGTALHLGRAWEVALRPRPKAMLDISTGTEA